MLHARAHKKLRRTVRVWHEHNHLDELPAYFEGLEKTVGCDPEFRCGWGPFSTSCKDPFLLCCICHDIEYVKEELGLQTKTRKQVDDEFKKCMEQCIDQGKGTKVRARLYYALARSPIGWLAWNT